MQVTPELIDSISKLSVAVVAILVLGLICYYILRFVTTIQERHERVFDGFIQQLNQNNKTLDAVGKNLEENTVFTREAVAMLKEVSTQNRTHHKWARTAVEQNKCRLPQKKIFVT